MKEKEIDIQREEQLVWGWESADKAAAEIYNSTARNLLEGSPVFLYKNTTNKGNLQMLVVSRNYDYVESKSTDYGVFMVYTGYTAYLPHVPFQYLQENILGYLQDSDAKVEKEVVENYKRILEYGE